MNFTSRIAPIVCLLATATLCGCGQSEPARTHSRGTRDASSASSDAPNALRGDVAKDAVAIERDAHHSLDAVTSSGGSARYRLVNFEDDEFSITAPPSRTVLAPGQAGEVRVSLTEAKQMALSNNMNIEVLGFNPPAVETQIDTAQSVFDPVLRVNSIWERIDEQTRDSVSSLSTTSNILNEDRYGNENEIVSLSKLFSSGLEARVSYVLGFVNQTPAGNLTQVNPSWGSRIRFDFEQPLFMNAGSEYNLAPIYIAQANFEESMQQFQVAVNTILLKVESTYWNLYVTQQNLVAAKQSTKGAKELYEKQVDLLKLGTGTKPDVDQALLQYQTFRVARIQALNDVLAAEREFRRAVGLEAYEQAQIVPSTKPSDAKYIPNWQQAIHESYSRPELEAQRMAIEAAHLVLSRAYNQLLPDVRGVAGYTINGLDNNWDESISTIFDNQYTNWRLGFRYERPFWKRAENAQVRQAEYLLGREQAAYRNIADVVMQELHGAYQNLLTTYEVLELRRTQRRLAEGQLKSRAELFGADMTNRVRFKDDLEAQQNYFAAIQLENSAQSQYRIAIAEWKFAKGTLLDDDDSIQMEPPPQPEEEPVPPPAPEAGSQRRPAPSSQLALPGLEVPLIDQPQMRAARGTQQANIAARNQHVPAVVPPRNIRTPQPTPIVVRPQATVQTPIVRQPQRSRQEQPIRSLRPHAPQLSKAQPPKQVAPSQEQGVRAQARVATKVRDNAVAPKPAITTRSTPVFDLKKALMPLHKPIETPGTPSFAKKPTIAPAAGKSSGPPIKIEYAHGKTIADAGEHAIASPPVDTTVAKKSRSQESLIPDVRFTQNTHSSQRAKVSVESIVPANSFTLRQSNDRRLAKRKTLEFVGTTHRQLAATPQPTRAANPTIRFAKPVVAKPCPAAKPPTHGNPKFIPASTRRAAAPRKSTPALWLPKLGFDTKQPSRSKTKVQPVATSVSSPASAKTTTVTFR